MIPSKYLNNKGKPTEKLLEKLACAKKVYLENLTTFCNKHFLDISSLREIKSIFLIGSCAADNFGENSDLDLKLVNPLAIPENLLRYKREVLNPLLCNPDKLKRDWVDIYFAREEYQVSFPRVNLTNYWDNVSL